MSTPMPASTTISEADSVAGVAVAEARIERLKLYNFRNYADLTLDLGEPLAVVLAGENGAGKTNLMEAVSFLSPGRGLRSAKLSEVSRRGAHRPWAVAARIAAPGGRYQLGTGLQVGLPPRDAIEDADDDISTISESPVSDRREVKIDGDRARTADFARLMSVVWLMPRMDRLFMEGASARRKFFDQLVLALHPDHGRQLAACERALRERLRLLTAPGRPPDPDWVGALERQIAEHAVAIAAARNDTLDHLAGFMDTAPEAGFPGSLIALEGTLETALRGAAALAVEDSYLQTLAAQRTMDARTGRTATGPHRSDLVVTHRAKNMPARSCSTGEQKALLIGLVLANAEMLRALNGAAPILLLDEIAAHLDRRRRQALFARLTTLGGQVWMTGTDMALFDDLADTAQRFEISAGTVSKWPK